MLNIKTEQKGETVILHLSGTIDESTDFKALLGLPKPGSVLDCQEIKRINSAGVKAWFKYFQIPSIQQAKLTLANCPPSLVEQFNMFSNFAGNMKVESVIGCFLCSGCKTENLVSLKTAEIASAEQDPAPVKCTQCGGTASFDDDPGDYFRFLGR